MKALTLKEPWAHCVAHLGKDVENRVWPTRHRGLLAIHSGAPVSARVVDEVYDEVSDLVGESVALSLSLAMYDIRAKADSCIVAVTRVVDCIPAVCCESRWAMPDPNPDAKEVWAWVLRDTFALPCPVSHKGRLRLWDLTGDTLEAVLAQLPESMKREVAV